MKTDKSNKNPLVCVFDSGIGGLNLLKYSAQKLPFCDFAYFADNYNVPYGNLPNEKIMRLADEKFRLMQSINCQAAVIACNTVTALCAEKLREKYPFPIIGIQPAIKQAAKKGGEIAVFATEATVRSQSFIRLISTYGTNKTHVYPLKNLAQKIEENILNLSTLNLNELLPSIRADAVVLGCTHYIYLKNAIQKHYLCEVYDGIVGTIDHLCTFLGNFDHTPSNKQKITFLCGDFNKNSLIYTNLPSF